MLWLAVTMTPLRHWMPLEGIQRRPKIATTDVPTASAAAASSFESVSNTDDIVLSWVFLGN
jgi:hypothetical protein